VSIDDRIRTATQAFGATVREVRPLDLPDAPHRARVRPRVTRSKGWLIPLAAAAAVIAIATALAAVHHDNTQPARPPVPVRPAQGIPRYFVAMKITMDSDVSFASSLIIGDDQAGTVIATVPAPRGVVFGPTKFASITEAGDDRTFVVTAPSDHLDTFYLLRIAPGSARPYRLAKLPIAPVSDPSSLALSPDGSKLAVLNNTRLTVFSVASGKALRTWRGDTLHTSDVSWEPDGRHIVFYAWSPRSQIRMLDVTAHATDIFAASRALVAIPASDNCDSARLAPDGKTVTCATLWGVQSPRPGGATEAPVCASANAMRILSYPVPAGRPARLRYLDQDHCHPGQARVLWMDASARHIIAAFSSQTTGTLGLITKAGNLQPVRLPIQVTAPDYAFMAF
jgi:hypothetical protein